MTDFGKRAGDMFKSTYDTDADGTVDDSEKLQASTKAQVQDHTPKSHAHAQADVTNLATALDGKSPTGHPHAQADVTNLATALDGKSPTGHPHAQADVTNLATALDGKSPTGHTHTESEISDLDHDALKIKGVIINDAAIGDQKVLAYDLGTERIVYITPAPSGAVLASIQRGSTTIPGGSTDVDVTITEVNMSKTFLAWGGSSATGDREGWGALRLLNSTTLRVRHFDTDVAAVLDWHVIEFSEGVTVQRGWTNMGIGELTKDVTITEVDLSKSFVNKLQARGDPYSVGNAPDLWTRVRFLNSATVRLERAEADLTNNDVSWEVVEFT